MHITMVNNYLYLRGGSERVMFEEAELLRSQQVTVSYFSRRHARNITTAYDDYFPPLVEPECLSVGGKFQQMPRVLYNRQTYRQFSQFLQCLNPQLIHAHNIYGGLTSAICDAAQHHKIPMVMTLHDYKLLCPSYLMLRNGQVCEACRKGAYLHCIAGRCHKGSLIYSVVYTLESYLTRWGGKYNPIRRFICPSEFIRHQMIAAGFSPGRVSYIPNAVDVDRYDPCTIPGDYLLYVGRLSKEKGIITLLSALQDLNMPLAIVGDGPLRGEVEAYIQQHDMSERVMLHGYQSGEALARLYQHAAFIVIPSEWYENAPMTVLEAFAYGKAVVGAHIGGIPEMIIPDRTGLLVPPGNAKALRTAIYSLWGDRSKAMDMGRNAREVVATRFSLQRHSEELQALYHEVLTECL